MIKTAKTFWKLYFCPTIKENVAAEIKISNWKIIFKKKKKERFYITLLCWKFLTTLNYSKFVPTANLKVYVSPCIF